MNYFLALMYVMYCSGFTIQYLSMMYDDCISWWECWNYVDTMKQIEIIKEIIKTA